MRGVRRRGHHQSNAAVCGRTLWAHSVVAEEMAALAALREAVAPVINAAGANTLHSGSRMRPEAFDAVEAVHGQFYNLLELLDAAGEAIVGLVDPAGQHPNLEAAAVCAGAATGMAIMAAAALTCGDASPARRAALPRTDGFASELVVQRSHSINYDQSWEITGGSLVFAGAAAGCTAVELEACVHPGRTAALLFLAEKPATLTLPEVVAVARKHSLPVLVDAASVLPSKTRLTQYLDEGAAMVCFKGGGAIRGPQSTGLVLGQRQLIAEARANGFPNQSIMRAAKVCKEEIFGLVAAVEGFMADDEPALLAGQTADMQRLATTLATAVPGVATRVVAVHPSSQEATPFCVIKLEGPRWSGAASAEAIAEQLCQVGQEPVYTQTYLPLLTDVVVWNAPACQAPREGEPRIFMSRLLLEVDELAVIAQMLQPGEAETIGAVLLRCLGEHASTPVSRL